MLYAAHRSDITVVPGAMFVNYRQKRSGISTVYWHLFLQRRSLQKPIVHSLGVLHCISYAPISIRRFQRSLSVALKRSAYLKEVRSGTAETAGTVATAIVIKQEAKLKPFSRVCSRHFVNGGCRRYGPLPALLTPMPYPLAIAEEALTTVLPTLHGVIDSRTQTYT